MGDCVGDGVGDCVGDGVGDCVGEGVGDCVGDGVSESFAISLFDPSHVDTSKGGAGPELASQTEAGAARRQLAYLAAARPRHPSSCLSTAYALRDRESRISL